MNSVLFYDMGFYCTGCVINREWNETNFTVCAVCTKIRPINHISQSHRCIKKLYNFRYCFSCFIYYHVQVTSMKGKDAALTYKSGSRLLILLLGSLNFQDSCRTVGEKDESYVDAINFI